MTQIELYERFGDAYSELNLGKIYFQKCKPWYVTINTTRNTCFCQYHIEYSYYYHAHTHTHILCIAQQPCVGILIYITFDIIQRLYSCHIVYKTKRFTFYQKYLLDETCHKCGGMALLIKCIHASDEYAQAQMEVNLQSLEYVTYNIEGRKERKKI